MLDCMLEYFSVKKKQLKSKLRSKTFEIKQRNCFSVFFLIGVLTLSIKHRLASMLKSIKIVHSFPSLVTSCASGDS